MTMMHRDFRTVPVPPEPLVVGIYQPAIDYSPPIQSTVPVTHFEVERRIYGYLVRKIEHLPRRVSCAQGAAWLIAVVIGEQGVATLAAARAFYAVDAVTAMTALSAGLATWALLFVATRGYLSDVEVDLRCGSLREVMSHRTGRVSLLREIPFGAIKGLRSVPRATRRMTATDGADDWILICQFGNDDIDEEMEIASGAPELIVALEALMQDHLRAVPKCAMTAVDPVAQLLLVQRSTSMT